MQNLKRQQRQYISKCKDYMTSEKNIFTAGDSRRGQSLVVWAIREGREAASSIHKYLNSLILY